MQCSRAFFVVLVNFWCVLSIDKEAVRLQIDTFIRNGYKDSSCTGQAAVTVGAVLDGEVIISEAYGLRDIDKKMAADKKTLFGIGSTSKAFTAIVTDEVLKEQGYTWDDPIITFYPKFALWGKNRTTTATFRDLFSHVMCLRRDDFWWSTGPDVFDLDDVMEKIRFIQEDCEFRSEFRYNNLMFVIGSHIVEELSGKSWATLIQEKIFDPLEMTSTKPYYSDAAVTGNYAIGYEYLDGVFLPMQADADKVIDLVGQAGSIYSTADDMLKYLAYLIENSDDFEELFWTKNVDIGYHFGTTMKLQKPSFPVTASATTYSIAWGLGEYEGDKILSHGGDTFSTHTFITISRAHKFGIFVSATGNNVARAANQLITWYIQDLLLGNEPWLNDTSYCSFPEPWVPKGEEQKLDQDWVKFRVAADSSLITLCGVYSSFVYGSLSVSLGESNELFFQYNKLNCTLRQHKENTMTFRCHAQVPYYVADTRSFQLHRIVNVKFNEDRQSLETDMADKHTYTFLRDGGAAVKPSLAVLTMFLFLCSYL